ncbi:hypothetical protein LNI91_12070, partial [Tenacibaculum dicentrarchi]|nr:hypothetical protein [Tenacibaculum dicentrarchi]
MNKSNFSLHYFYLLLLVVMNIFSQEAPANQSSSNNDTYIQKITPPNVASFLKTKLINVNNYTGNGSVSVPIYVINEGNISIPIQLNYNSTGVKVNETASNVGLNWSLEAGGSITKIIKGIEDFSLSFRNVFRKAIGDEINNNDECGKNNTSCQGLRKIKFDDFTNPVPILKESQLYKIGWMLGSKDVSVQNYFDYASNFPDKIITSKMLNVPPSLGSTQRDMYPDIYYVNAPGLNTKFMHRKDKTAFEIKYQGNKIRTTVGKSDIINFLPSFYKEELHDYIKTYYGSKPRRITCVNKIEITNINGVEYLFDKLDVNQYVSRGASIDVNMSTPMHVSSQEVTSYHLSSIKDIKGNKIHFDYESYAVSEFKNNKSTNFLIQSDGSFMFLGEPTITDVYYPLLQRIKKIRYSKGSVYFSYLKNSRLDLPGDNALDSIIIKDIHDKIIKKFKFKYDYFVANTNCNEEYCLRLKLKSITEYNSNNKKLPSHEFFYDETQLPEVGSSNVDYLGYANSVKDDYSLDRHPTAFKKPFKLYFKPKKKGLTISPIPIFNNSSIITENGVSLEPSFKYTKAGTLIKMKKPTGAIQYFTYELNTFSTSDIKDIKAGGLRLKKQIIKDEKGHIKLLEEYSYKDNNGFSSGRLNNMPLFGDVAVNFNYDKNSTPFKYALRRGLLNIRTYTSIKNNIELILGNNIGYGRVVIKNGINNGVIEREYSTIEEYPIELPIITGGRVQIMNLGIEYGANIPYFNNDKILIGRLKKETIKNSNGKVIKEKKIEYTNKVYEKMNETIPFVESDLYYKSGLSEVSKITPKIYSQRNLETKITNKIFFLNETIESTNTMVHESNYSVVKESRTTSNQNDIIKTKNYFVTDVEQNNSLGNKNLTEEEFTAINILKEKNRIIQPIQTEIYKNDVLIRNQRTNFKNWENNIVLPKDIEVSKGESLLEDRVVYHNYDDKGNPIEVSKKDGTKIYYVWGYEQTQPIAKI